LETVVKKLYEAMFLVDSAQAASDWDGVNKTIETLLKKADAEIVSIQKWDERKLSYEIRGHSRGTYILCYFRVDGTRIRGIEREVQLSERIMRVLILSAESMSQEHIEKDTPFMKVERQRQKAVTKAEESLVMEKAEELSEASALAEDQSFEAVLSETEQAESEESDEPGTEPAESKKDEKEKDAETGP
jgi:small subunit ribosomal protein S6